MRKVIFMILFLAGYFTAVSQSVGVNNNTPNANAVLDIKQTSNQGLLIPRGNAATRTALNSNSAKGLMLYDTVTNSLWIHNGNGLASGWTNQQVIAPAGSVIPFASGSPISITTNSFGNPATVALLGFGNNISGVTPVGGNIDLATVSNGNYAFSMPRDGTIKSISMFFSTTSGTTVGGSFANVNAQLYMSSPPSNFFTPVASTLINVFYPPGPIAIGTFSYNWNALSVPVTNQSRLLLVFSISNPGGFVPLVMQGSASAGITIE